jgi:hypothetical protein
MTYLKRKDSGGLMIEKLTDIRIEFARKTGWYIPQLHDRYIRMEVGDQSS